MPSMRLGQETIQFRRGRWRAFSVFRKTCRSRLHSYLPGIQNPTKKSRTSLEGPFGEVIRATGPMAKANPFRFSTKYQDDETDLLYYGHRYLAISMGNWLNRDPMEENGGHNLYCRLSGDCVNNVDPLGLKLLLIGFGYDESVERTFDLYREIADQIAFLQRAVDKCIQQTDCGCQETEDLRVASISDYGHDKPAPSDYDYDFRTFLGGDYGLMQRNLKSVKYGQVHVVMTASSISIMGNTRYAYGYGLKSEGVLLADLSWTKDVIPLPDWVLAHEVGHVADYIGDDPKDRYHSSDPQNLMNPYGGGTSHNVDCQWCQKVLGLAR